MNRWWPLLLPELREFPAAEQDAALGQARDTGLDAFELLGMAAGLIQRAGGDVSRAVVGIDALLAQGGRLPESRSSQGNGPPPVRAVFMSMDGRYAGNARSNCRRCPWMDGIAGNAGALAGDGCRAASA